MKDSFLDKTLTEVYSTVDKISSKISDDFKNTKPFDKKPISDDEMVVYYSQLTPGAKSFLIQQYGADAILYFDDLEKKLRRRQNNA